MRSFIAMCDEQFILTATLNFMTVNKNTVLLDVTQSTRVFQNTVTYSKTKLSLSTPLSQTGTAEV